MLVRKFGQLWRITGTDPATGEPIYEPVDSPIPQTTAAPAPAPVEVQDITTSTTKIKCGRCGNLNDKAYQTLCPQCPVTASTPKKKGAKPVFRRVDVKEVVEKQVADGKTINVTATRDNGPVKRPDGTVIPPEKPVKEGCKCTEPCLCLNPPGWKTPWQVARDAAQLAAKVQKFKAEAQKHHPSCPLFEHHTLHIDDATGDEFDCWHYCNCTSSADQKIVEAAMADEFAKEGGAMGQGRANPNAGKIEEFNIVERFPGVYEKLTGYDKDTGEGMYERATREEIDDAIRQNTVIRPVGQGSTPPAARTGNFGFASGVDRTGAPCQTERTKIDFRRYGISARPGSYKPAEPMSAQQLADFRRNQAAMDQELTDLDK